VFLATSARPYAAGSSHVVKGPRSKPPAPLIEPKSYKKAQGSSHEKAGPSPLVLISALFARCVPVYLFTCSHSPYPPPRPLVPGLLNGYTGIPCANIEATSDERPCEKSTRGTARGTATAAATAAAARTAADRPTDDDEEDGEDDVDDDEMEAVNGMASLTSPSGDNSVGRCMSTLSNPH